MACSVLCVAATASEIGPRTNNVIRSERNPASRVMYLRSQFTGTWQLED
jgi:hypothetical protein